ncbi:MAG: hypothetical protein KDN19_18720 [Verrucomicrobiae bacterium]|nr:hypothetical protein [Verrucomicrobiae bacterium]
MRFLRSLIAIAVLTPSLSFGFLPNPDLLTISPAVAKAGSSVEVSCNGTDLDELRDLHFSHPGIKAEPVMQPADEFHPEPRPVDGKFTVSVAADVAPGIYEVRSLGYFGLSTARPFMVLPADRELIQEEGDHSTRETAMAIPGEAGINGTLDGGKFDWYRFSAKKGERLLLHLWAERMDSKADVIMAVADVEGRELENSRHHFERDPFIDFTAPADGDYFISLNDAIYSGGREYFYHLRVTHDPHIDFVFPPAGMPGQKQKFTLFGRNLPGGSLGENWEVEGKPLETKEVELQVPTEVKTPEGFSWTIPRSGMLPGFEYALEDSDPVRIGFATAPVVTEQADAEEQKITLPVEIAGRFDEPGDVDVFRFSAKKGQTFWIDVVSHRLGVLADPYVLIEKVGKDKDGAETFTKVVENDDLPSFYGSDSLDDLNADSLDPGTSFTADADGDYRIALVNQSAGGSAAHLYRLAVREASPDFQLLADTELTKTINNDAYPNAPLIRRNGSMIYRIIAFRRDGFEGDITVTAKGLPKGVTAEPLVLSGKTDQGFLTLWSTPDAPAWSGTVDISGVARIGDKEVTRAARSASIIWGRRVFGNQAQVRSRLDCETVLSVMDTEINPTRVAAKENKVWTVEMNQSLEIPFTVADDGTRTGNLQVEVHGFPGMLRSPPTATVAEKAKEGTVKIDFKPNGNFKAEPGRYQFVLQGIGNAKYRQNPAAAERADAELKRIEALLKTVTGDLEKAKATVAQAEKDLASATQAEAAAADDAARAAKKKETEAAKAAVDAAKKAQADNEAKLKQAEALKTAAEKTAKAAADKAKEKSTQFATYSLPITVEVKPEPEKK